MESEGEQAISSQIQTRCLEDKLFNHYATALGPYVSFFKAFDSG